jgi:hypothetical protein
MFCKSLFVFFLWDIVLFILLRYVDSNYPHGIFKLFLKNNDISLFTAILITYIKGGTPAQIFLETGSAMTRATFVFFFTEVLKFY